MVLDAKRSGAIVLRLIVGLALLGCPRAGFAQGNWSVISVGPKLGEVVSPQAVAVDTAGNLYVADWSNDRILKRDAQGSWSVLATPGTAPGQVQYPAALAVDAAGSLYVADGNPVYRIQKRDAQGNWSEIAAKGTDLGQIFILVGLAVDGAGDLYVADSGRIQKRDAQGNGSILDANHSGLLAVDTAGNLYVADDRIRKRDVRGNWSVVAPTYGDAAGQVVRPSALAVDTAGNLYVADVLDWNTDIGRVQKRDAQGNWSVIENQAGDNPILALAVDTAGNLYVANNDGIQKRNAQGSWSVIADEGIYPGQVTHLTALAEDTAGNL